MTFATTPQRRFTGWGRKCQDTMPQLIAALKDDHQGVQRYAAKALAKIGSPARDAIPDLRSLSHSHDTTLREVAQEAVEAIEGK